MISYYIYRFLDKNDNIIYIGKTNSMDKRFFYEEYAHFSKGTHLPEDCYKEIKRIEFTEFASESEQTIYEAFLINKLRPKYNKQFVDTGQIKMELPDFKWNEWQQFTDEIKLYLEKRLNKSQSIQECLAEIFKNIEIDCYEKNGRFMNTGYIGLDEMMMIKGSNLILLSGVQGIGKTVFSLSMCNFLLKRSNKVLFINLKDENETVTLKLVSQKCQIPYKRLVDNRLTQEDWGVISENTKYFESANLLISNDSSIEAIVDYIESKDFDAIFIDDLIMIENKNDYYNKDKVCDTLRKLKNASMKAKCPVFLLYQLSLQKISKRSDNRPILTDLDYDSFLNFCDSIIFLHRDDAYNPETEKRNIMEVIIAKNIYGNGTFELFFIPTYMTVANIAEDR